MTRDVKLILSASSTSTHSDLFGEQPLATPSRATRSLIQQKPGTGG
jgi:hypothetical protein